MTADLTGDCRATPDPEAIRTFADIVFGRLTGLVPIRLLAEGEAKGRPRTPYAPSDAALHRTLARYAKEASELGSGLFVVPGTVGSRRARACDILQLSAVLVDLDEGDIESNAQHLLTHLGEAGLVVASGGGTPEGQERRHLYWPLAEVAEGKEQVAKLCAIRAEIAAKVGGDPHFSSPHQPIRVPGSVHLKGSARPVRIVSASGKLANVSELIAASAAMPALVPSATQRLRSRRPRVSKLMSSVTHAGAMSETSRFDALSSVIGHWLREVGEERVSLENAWTHVCEFNLACVVPPWPEHRLRKEFDALRVLDLEKRRHAPPPPLSEDDLANRFTAAHGADWAYVATWGRWLRWTGQVWRTDAERRLRECIRLECRSAARTVANPRDVRRLGSASTYAGAERIAQSDPRHAVHVDAWDEDREALNTPAGILDLRTMNITPHRRDAKMTRMAGASPQGDCPRWRSFLDEISDGDGMIVRYLARIAGYCLTGLTYEHAFFVFHGEGANGKSTFVSVLRGILADYATSAPIETFVAGNGERHPTDLAGLTGARLVTAIETEEGRSWAESKIKALTGGDPVKARFIHKDFFEYTPQFKLIIVGNHKPRIRSFSEAMRRRIHLVPFNVTLPPERREKDLVETLLRTERDGILAWAVEGLVDWRRNGLSPPPAVSQATDKYFEEEDAVGDWLAERCVSNHNGFTGTTSLFADWRCWAEAAGEPPQSMRWLARELSRRGFVQTRTSARRGFSRLGLAGSPCKGRDRS